MTDRNIGALEKPECPFYLKMVVKKSLHISLTLECKAK